MVPKLFGCAEDVPPRPGCWSNVYKHPGLRRRCVRHTKFTLRNTTTRFAVFNFWEPLHYLDRGYGFQTWETSPVYAIRSWAYILLHTLPTKIVFTLLGPEKVSTLPMPVLSQPTRSA